SSAVGTDKAIFDYGDYTVGWICALRTELAAAKAMLDEQHQALPARHKDNNTYVLGGVGDHNVAIACLPSQTTGTVSAASVSQQMLATFESIRFGLMVGIGGGIPSVGIPGVKQSDMVDLRLGDVVVSDPDHDFGGVIQYRFGKTIGESEFIRTGTLNKPPSVLRTAVSNLKANHDMKGDNLPRHLSDVTLKYPFMKTKYSYQGMENDRLFAFNYDHVEDSDDTCCFCEPGKEVQRQARMDTRPAIFYGLIASDNNLMRHGGSREKLRRDLGVLCVEMEAAGLIDEFPCMVIRGICDYADTHKNKRWQPYAAATAAAYAKELLLVIPKSQVTTAQKATEITGEKARDDFGRNALHVASQHHDQKLVEEYIKHMTPEEIGQVDVGNFTPLHLSDGHQSVVDALISKMRPQDLGIVNSYGYTVLNESVMNWSTQVTETLLGKMLPKDINRNSPSGWTVLHLAANHGRESAVQPLLKKMSSRAIWALTLEPGRLTALHMAVQGNFVDATEAILAIADSVQLATRDDKKRTALHIAAEQGFIDIVRILLERMDADDVWNPDIMGDTALHKAAASGYRDVVKLILGKVVDGDDLMLRNGVGQTAREVAVLRRDKRVIRLIEEQEKKYQVKMEEVVDQPSC
ncbi:Vegetative incompatibility protein HET-E-1-like protein 16, partial [Fusarium oxysporum f. sp. phaseoli]